MGNVRNFVVISLLKEGEEMMEGVKRAISKEIFNKGKGLNNGGMRRRSYSNSRVTLPSSTFSIPFQTTSQAQSFSYNFTSNTMMKGGKVFPYFTSTIKTAKFSTERKGEFGEEEKYKRSHFCGEVGAKGKEKEEVALWGWLERIRPSGSKLVFATLRDYTGSAQLLFQHTSTSSEEEYQRLIDDVQKTTEESVVEVKGILVLKPTKKEGGKEEEYEVLVTHFRVLNPAKKHLSLLLKNFNAKATSAQMITNFSLDVEKERQKLENRILYLRSNGMQKRLRMRAKALSSLRHFLEENYFLEVETPTLFKRTAEGAREFLVPSSKEKGKFYALVQSPQQYKQMLMAGGIDRYFQIARCYRDEDLRNDRQPEFTQLDMELSCTFPHQMFDVIERMLAHLWKEVLDISLPLPFPRMKYSDALSKYGIDKPDTRFPFLLSNLSSLFTSSNCNFSSFSSLLPSNQNAASEKGFFYGVNLKKLGGAMKGQEVTSFFDDLQSISSFPLIAFTVKGDSSSPSLKWKANNNFPKTIDDQLKKVIEEEMGAEEGDLIVLSGHSHEEKLQTTIGKVRLMGINEMITRKIIPLERAFNFLWVVDFPLFSKVKVEESEKVTAGEDYSKDEEIFESTHHPFTAPVDEDLPLLYTHPERVRGQHYDCVLNGIELGGGSIRIHQPAVQSFILSSILKLSDQRVKSFDHLMEAFESGCPPHGGIAFGIDRLIALLSEDALSLRDVIAFPKAQSGREILVGSPAPVSHAELSELSLSLSSPSPSSSQ